MFFRENEERGRDVSSLHYWKWAAALTGEQVTLVSHVASVIRRPGSFTSASVPQG